MPMMHVVLGTACRCWEWGNSIQQLDTLRIHRSIESYLVQGSARIHRSTIDKTLKAVATQYGHGLAERVARGLEFERPSLLLDSVCRQVPGSPPRDQLRDGGGRSTLARGSW